MKHITIREVDSYLEKINLRISQLYLNSEDILKFINDIEYLENLLIKEYDSNKIYNISQKRIDILSDCLEDIDNDLCKLYSFTKNNNLRNGYLIKNDILIKIKSKNYFDSYHKWIKNQLIETRNKNSKYKRLNRRNNSLCKTPREIGTLTRFILCNYFSEQGLSNIQIAERLNISRRTVTNHLSNIHEINTADSEFKKFANDVIRNEKEKEKENCFNLTLDDEDLSFEERRLEI